MGEGKEDQSGFSASFLARADSVANFRAWLNVDRGAFLDFFLEEEEGEEEEEEEEEERLTRVPREGERGGARIA